MAIKKSELHLSTWASCGELRGGMDAPQYRGCVPLGLFVSYLADRHSGQSLVSFTRARGPNVERR